MLSLIDLKPCSFITDGMKFFNIPQEGDVVDRLTRYVLELARWNRHINLTGPKTPEGIITGLLYDAFFLYHYLMDIIHEIPAGTDGKGTAFLDLGSGSGILAIPLKILNNTFHIFSVDGNLKKIHFQKHVCRELGLTGIELIHGRIEAVGALAVDILTAKAVGDVETILRGGARHIKTGGHALLLRGGRDIPRDFHGFELKGTVPYNLPLKTGRYRLFIYVKMV